MTKKKNINKEIEIKSDYQITNTEEYFKLKEYILLIG